MAWEKSDEESGFISRTMTMGLARAILVSAVEPPSALIARIKAVPGHCFPALLGQPTNEVVVTKSEM
jgi:hypothetical protein